MSSFQIYPSHLNLFCLCFVVDLQSLDFVYVFGFLDVFPLVVKSLLTSCLHFCLVFTFPLSFSSTCTVTSFYSCCHRDNWTLSHSKNVLSITVSEFASFNISI